MDKRREQLNEFYSGMREMTKTMPTEMDGFNGMLNAIIKDGALDKKAKELISVALACYSRCEYCIVYHVYQAMKLKSSEQEIREAAMVAVVFGGGPAAAYIVTILSECFIEFKKDFE